MPQKQTKLLERPSLDGIFLTKATETDPQIGWLRWGLRSTSRIHHQAVWGPTLSESIFVSWYYEPLADDI